MSNKFLIKHFDWHTRFLVSAALRLPVLAAALRGLPPLPAQAGMA
jgi:hypothetical protein